MIAVLVLALLGLWSLPVVGLLMVVIWDGRRSRKDSLEEAFRLLDAKDRHPAGKRLDDAG